MLQAILLIGFVKVMRKNLNFLFGVSLNIHTFFLDMNLR